MARDKKYEKRMSTVIKPASNGDEKPEVKKIKSRKITKVQRPFKRKELAGGKKVVTRKGVYSDKTGKYYSSVRQRKMGEDKLKGGTEPGDYNPRTGKKQAY